MPLPHAKKQKTLGCIREIQVCKLRTKAYSQKRLPAMLYTCVCIAECVTSVASFLVNATGIVVMFAVLIVGNPATIITFLRITASCMYYSWHCKLAQAVFCPFHCWCCCHYHNHLIHALVTFHLITEISISLWYGPFYELAACKIPKLCNMHVNDLSLIAGKQYGRKKVWYY